MRSMLVLFSADANTAPWSMIRRCRSRALKFESPVSSASLPGVQTRTFGHPVSRAERFLLLPPLVENTCKHFNEYSSLESFLRKDLMVSMIFLSNSPVEVTMTTVGQAIRFSKCSFRCSSCSWPDFEAAAIAAMATPDAFPMPSNISRRLE